MKKNYSPQQLKFLEVLFEEAEGDPTKAKKIAGYSENTRAADVLNTLEDEVFELTKKYIVRVGTKAAYAMNHIIDNPTALGNRERLAAAKEVLDRAGFNKTEKVEVKSDTPVFILPAKEENDD